MPRDLTECSWKQQDVLGGTHDCTDTCFSSEGYDGCFLLTPDAPPELIWSARLESQQRGLGKSSFLLTAQGPLTMETEKTGVRHPLS